MIHESESVCFCLARRHPNIFIGKRLPSNCRYCNSAFDLTSVMSKEQAQARGLLKMPEEPSPKAQETESPAPAQPPQINSPLRGDTPAQPGLGMHTPAQPGLGMHTPAQPGLGMHTPAQPGLGMHTPAQPGLGMHRPPQPAFTPPAHPGFGYFAPAPSHTSPIANTCRLDYFGENIEIPHEGGWLGRSAIGTEWFKGNLLISREHIKVLPMADGRLQVGPDKSLNGTSITSGGRKRTLDRSETTVLSAGDTLWLYNVPLQLKGSSS